MFATEPTVEGAERRRMSCREYGVFVVLVDEFGKFHGRFAPEHKNDSLAFFRNRSDDVVREPFPTFLGVRIGLGLENGQNGVQQKDALFRPRRQVAVFGDGETRYVLLELLVNVE